jgi:hypothetical protein
MPISKYYKPVAGSVKIPDPNDPVNMTVQPNMTTFDFGSSAEPSSVLGGMPAQDLRQGLLDLFKGKQAVPPAPPMPQLQSGYEPLEMDYASVTSKPYQIPQAEKPKPQQSYGTNRGGTGGAGRGPQLGKSQFDIGPQFMEPEQGMSIADLRMLDDKPWELDDNTKADVASGTSLEPQKDNVTDKMPDLNTPQGLYSALAKKYPDMLQQNLEQVQQARVSMEDVDALRDRGGLGSLFIAASKAASGAGSIGGKTAESIAEKIVTREDTLARQQLKDRLDVANENMQMNARAVDLAIKQIDFADEREQYDPNSDVSQFARDFMLQEFDVKVPVNVPAYQLKQFLPAILQKHQAQERAQYQRALLGQRTEESLINDAYKRYETATRSGDKQAQIEAQKEIARLRAMQKAQPQAPKPEKPPKMLGDVPADVAKVEMDLAGKYRADKTVQAHELMKNELAQLRTLATEGTPQSDQALITKFAKILDPGSVVRETEFAITERGGGLIDSMRNTLSKAAGTGRLQPGQRQNLIQTAEALFRGIEETYQAKRQQYIEQGKLYGARPEAVVGVEQRVPTAGGDTLPSGKKRLTPQEKQKLEDYRRRKAGGQ